MRKGGEVKPKRAIRLSGKGVKGHKSSSYRNRPKRQSRAGVSSERGSRSSSYKAYDDTVRAFVVHLQRRGYSGATLRLYRFLLGRFAAWLAESGVNDPLAATAADLENFQTWVSEEGTGHYAPGYAANFTKVIRGLYRFLAEERLIMPNPARALRYPKKERRLRRDVLTETELTQLLRAPTRTREAIRDAAAVSILAMSGLRVSELAALDLDDVDLAEREVIVRKGKGAKGRMVFFDRSTRSALAKYLTYSRPFLVVKRERALIVGDNGRRMKPRRIEVLVDRRFKAARVGRRVTPHGLRRTFATLLLKHGANIKVIGELMGHAGLDSTAIYTRLDISELSRVYRQAHPRGEG